MKLVDQDVYNLALKFAMDADEFKDMSDEHKTLRADDLAKDIQNAIEDYFYGLGR